MSFNSPIKDLRELLTNIEKGQLQLPDFQRSWKWDVDRIRSLLRFALEDPSPNRIGFDLGRILRTNYRIDDYQQAYFVIDSFKQLIDATGPAFTPIYARLAQQPSIPAGAVQDSDQVFQRGNGEGWSSDGDV